MCGNMRPSYPLRHLRQIHLEFETNTFCNLTQIHRNVGLFASMREIPGEHYVRQYEAELSSSPDAPSPFRIIILIHSNKSKYNSNTNTVQLHSKYKYRYNAVYCTNTGTVLVQIQFVMCMPETRENYLVY